MKFFLNLIIKIIRFIWKAIKSLFFIVTSILFLYFIWKGINFLVNWLPNRHFFISLKYYFGWDDFLAILIGLAGISYLLGLTFSKKTLWKKLHEDIYVELIAIAITVLLIGNANQYTQSNLEKKLLIFQMGSQNNSTALEAVRQLKARGWLYDGTLSGVNLQNANLRGVDLSNTENLQSANLMGVDLSNADMEDANLNNADMSNARLINTNLQNASLSGVK